MRSYNVHEIYKAILYNNYSQSYAKSGSALKQLKNKFAERYKYVNIVNQSLLCKDHLLQEMTGL